MENTLPTTIAKQNTTLLATLSVAFFVANGIKPEMMDAFADATMDTINKWYNENLGRDFDLTAELVEEEAVMFAFKEMQGLYELAQLARVMGITPAELGIA